MAHHSLWENISHRKTTFPKLSSQVEVDVAIIGGGITGITAALELVKAGKKVAVLESYTMGGVTTGHSTGNLYVPTQFLFQNIVKKFGLKDAKQVANARREAIDYIENNVNAYQLGCQFSRRPTYIYGQADETQTVQAEQETLKKLGILTEQVAELPYGFKSHRAFMVPNQARFNPLQYVLSLAEALQAQGALLFEHSRALQITEDKIYQINTAEGSVKAKALFLATHSPLGINRIQAYTAAYRSYVLAVALEEGHYPDCKIRSLSHPHFVLSTHAMDGQKPNILTIAGSHHKTGQDLPNAEHFKAEEAFLKQHFSKFEIQGRWSAQHFHSADGLPYIGLAKGKENYYIATGYFADGLVYGSIAGRLVAEKILHKQEKSSKGSPFNAERHKFLASLKFLGRENMNVLLQYAKDFPQKEDKNFSELKAGEGKIVELNQEKIAVCRDAHNKLHKVSAVCTHMKCIVAWNNAEQTWDCPCHGSRFKASGEVLEGPAMSELKPID